MRFFNKQMTTNDESEELFNNYRKKEDLVVEDKELSIKKNISLNEYDLPQLREALTNALDGLEEGDLENLEQITDALEQFEDLGNLLGGGSANEEKLQEEIDRLKNFYDRQLDRIENKYERNLEKKVEELEEKLEEKEEENKGGGGGGFFSGREAGKRRAVIGDTADIDLNLDSEDVGEVSEQDENVTGANFDINEKNDNAENMVEKIEDTEEEYTSGQLETQIQTFEKAEKKSESRKTPPYFTTEGVVEDAPYKNYKEVERYWLNKPYSYAKILYNEKQGDHRYYVVEPDLTEKEEFVFERTNEILKDKLLHEDIKEEQTEEESRQILREKTEETIENLDVNLDKESMEKIYYYIERDHIGYEKLDPIMHDDYVEDISCDGTGIPIFVYHKEYRNLMTNVVHKEETKLRSLITKLAQMSGQHISTAEPIKSITLPDGSRGEVTLGESSDKGPTYTIRKFQDIPFTPVDLIRTGTFNTTQMAYLWLAIEEETSLIFAGGTGSGKTTSMNAISMFIPPKSKIVTIEDTREISLPHQNWVPLVTREQLNTGEGDATGIDEFELLRSALRQNPEYLIVGEIRGEEAKTLFQAMSTGHTTYSTMHAEDPNEAIRRLENDPINVPRQMINALDIISVQKQQRIRGEKGMKKIRRNKTIMEIKNVPEEGTADGVPVFEWEASDDKFKERLRDSLILKGIMEKKGWNYDEISKDLKNRKRVLQYLLDKEVRDVEMVAKVIRTYMSEPNVVLSKIKDGTLEDTDFEDITSSEEITNISLDQQPDKTEEVITNE